MANIKILNYHRVENLSDDFNMLAVSPDNFRAHIKFLKNQYNIVDLKNLDNDIKNEERDSVIITFDDGYYDLLYNALPILEEFEVPATMFITTGNIGTRRENWTDSILRAIFNCKVYHEEFSLKDDWIDCSWNTKSMQERIELYKILRVLLQCSCKERREIYEKKLLEWAGLSEQGRIDRRILTEEEIKKLAKSPFVTIGAHCVTHPSLRWLDLEEQKSEIHDSKIKLEEIIGRKVDLFAYPFGTLDDYSESTIQILKKEGYDKAVTTQQGEISLETDRYQIPRVGVRNYNEEEFQNFIIYKVLGEVEREPKKRSTGITYMGSFENDFELLKQQVKVVIWGCGFWGKELLETLEKNISSSRIIAFGDNNLNKIGKVYCNLEIKSAEEIKKLQKKEKIIILVKGIYDREICKELVKKGINNIHLLTRN